MGEPSAKPLPSESGVESVPTAPAWHTAVVLLLFAAMAAAAVHGGHRPAAQIQHRLLGYTISMVAEWLIFGFIAIGPLWHGSSLKALAGRFSPTLRSVAL